MSESFAALDQEFAGIAESAATAGLGPDAVPRVRRNWVTGPDGEHVSVVVWGSGPAEVVFVHEAGRSARAWDEVALRLGRPSIAIDLPGHGRSGWRPDGRYAPRKLAGAIAEAMRSLAPQARLVVGSGLGGRAALALITTPRPAFLPRLALIDTLPGTAARGQEAGVGTERFADRGEAVARLAGRHPEWQEAALRREADCELVRGTGGSWKWRHHIGNLADSGDSYFDDVTLWEELAGLAKPAFVIHGARSGRLTGADLLELERRTPRVALITIPGVADVVASEPGRLASQLNRLVSAD
jgi:pimeloyl-ACP methyl ester carboxylesterase